MYIHFLPYRKIFALDKVFDFAIKSDFAIKPSRRSIEICLQHACHLHCIFLFLGKFLNIPVTAYSVVEAVNYITIEFSARFCEGFLLR